MDAGSRFVRTICGVFYGVMVIHQVTNCTYMIRTSSVIFFFLLMFN